MREWLRPGAAAGSRPPPPACLPAPRAQDLNELLRREQEEEEESEGMEDEY